jgi:hypothetical protein
MNSALRAVMTGAVVSVGMILSASSAYAQTNEGPPTGAIIDLGGTETGTAAVTIDHNSAAPASASGTFVASETSTDITLAFREDPAFVFVSDVTLTDLTTGSITNLIQDPDFALGTPGTNTDAEWAYANVYGASYGGFFSDSCGSDFATCWYDGAVQAYDAIDQYVPTTVGDDYDLSFEYWDDGGLTTFSDLSTNGVVNGTGGSGADILAYAQAGLPAAAGTSPIPEPSTLATLGTGLLSLAGIARRRFVRNA